MLKPQGKFCFVAQPLNKLSLDAGLLYDYAHRTIFGNYTGSWKNMKDMLAFSAKHNIEINVVAIETFISTTSTHAETLQDGWTMVGNKGGFIAQHEHTIVITDGKPIVLTEMNEIWN